MHALDWCEGEYAGQVRKRSRPNRSHIDLEPGFNHVVGRRPGHRHASANGPVTRGALTCVAGLFEPLAVALAVPQSTAAERYDDPRITGQALLDRRLGHSAGRSTPLSHVACVAGVARPAQPGPRSCAA